MATTQYKVFAGETQRETRTNKQTAVKLAEKIRADERVAVRVETANGKVVYTAAAPKTRVIKARTPKWTRVEDKLPQLGEGVELPDGYDVAYTRTRVPLAVLRKRGVKGDYVVIELDTGKQHPASNTIETAEIMTKVRRERQLA